MRFAVVFCLLFASAFSWEFLAEAEKSQPFSFYLALKHDSKKLAALKKEVAAIISPTSPRFAKHLTKAKVMSYLANPKSSVVVNHVKTICPGASVLDRQDSLAVHANVDCAERLFGVSLATYIHPELKIKGVALRGSSRPLKLSPNIAPFIHTVAGIGGPKTLYVPRKNAKKIVKDIASVPANITYGFISINEINRVYNVPTNKVANPKVVTVGVVEFISDIPGSINGEAVPSLSDLQVFTQMSKIPFNNVSRFVGPVKTAAECPECDTGESALDVQLLSSVAQTPFQYISINVSWVFGMATELFNLDNVPTVSSVSYGTDEIDQCSVGNCTDFPNDNRAYIERCEIELMKLTAIGAAVIVSSGDAGAVGRTNSDCHLDNTTAPLNPEFPGDSAWITSISGTSLQTINGPVPAPIGNLPICTQQFPCAVGGTVEVACQVNTTYYDWTTAGGFSSIIPRPLWQQEFVEEYFRDPTVTFPPPFTFNSNGRAFPDISAFGARILTVSNGQVAVEAGTSASAPIVAGLLTLLNDARVSVNKSPIGFWNPVLYLAKQRCPQCFNVVASGANNCGEGSCCKYGYEVGSASRYNTVTGLGSLNLKNMIQFVLTLP